MGDLFVLGGDFPECLAPGGGAFDKFDKTNFQNPHYAPGWGWGFTLPHNHLCLGLNLNLIEPLSTQPHPREDIHQPCEWRG